MSKDYLGMNDDQLSAEYCECTEQIAHWLRELELAEGLEYKSYIRREITKYENQLIDIVHVMDARIEAE